MQHSTWIFAIAGLAACGAVEEGDDMTGPAPTVIMIDREAGETVKVLAVREGDGAWRVLDAAATEFTLNTKGPYLLAAACARNASGRVQGAALGRHVSDGGSIALPCHDAKPAGAPVAIDGNMIQLGYVALGNSLAYNDDTAPWSYNLSVPAGTYDLVAWTPERVAMRRDQAVSVPTSWPVIDLDAEAEAWDYATTTIQGADVTEQQQATVVLSTGSTTMFAQFSIDTPTAPVEMPVLPTVMRRSSDRWFMNIDAFADNRAHGVFVDHAAGVPTDYTLMPLLDGVARDGRGATWGTLPDYSVLNMETTGGNHAETVEVSKAWVGARTSLAVDFAQIPGWDPAWVATAADSMLFAARSFVGERIELDTRVDFSSAARASQPRSIAARQLRNP